MNRPVVTFDIDGVLCRPPWGMNPGSGKGKRRDGRGRPSPLWVFERWRYTGRQPMPGAVEGWRILSEIYDCRVVSARSEQARRATETWFAQHFGFVPEVHLRPSWRETSAQFKVRKLAELGSRAHFEDDPHTAQWLADLLPIVFLVDWPRNHWLDGPHIQRIHRLGQARLDLERALAN